ncbi:MAG: hypothetical protein WCX73_05635 [Candidatus Pacearchaeota archaeon]
MDKKYYTAKELAKKFDINIQTVYSRFRSPYAKKRWGVTVVPRVDGSYQKVVGEDNLFKWFVETNNYVGRPINPD